MKRFSALWTVMLFLACASRGAQADTTLTFDGLGLSDYQAIPGNYGDHAAGTPHIGVSYHEFGAGATFPNNLAYWDSSYGDLFGVAFSRDNGHAAEIVLTPDPGWKVVLNSFDMAGWPTVDRVDDVLRLSDAGGNAYAGFDYAANAGGAYTVKGSGPSHSHFAPGLMSGGEIHIQFGHDWNAGIDNVNFSEQLSTVTPEAGSLGLLTGGLLVPVSAFLYRRRKTNS